MLSDIMLIIIMLIIIMLIIIVLIIIMLIIIMLSVVVQGKGNVLKAERLVNVQLKTDMNSFDD